MKIVHRIPNVVTGSIDDLSTLRVNLTRDQTKFLLPFIGSANRYENTLSFIGKDFVVVKTDPNDVVDGNKRRQHLSLRIDEKRSRRGNVCLYFVEGL